MLRLPFTGPEHVAAAARAVARVRADHAVAAVPTETFYGLAVDPSDDIAVARLFALKARPRGKALLVVGASLSQLEPLVAIPPAWRARLEAAWPAPLTVVLPARSRLPAGGGEDTLAVRVPGHALLRALLRSTGPLTATSANLSGGNALADPGRVTAELGDVALLLDGGPAPGGAASTIVDLSGLRARVVRAGAWQPPADWEASA